MEPNFEALPQTLEVLLEESAAVVVTLSPDVPEAAPVFLLLFLAPVLMILVSFFVVAILSPDFSEDFTGASVCSEI